MVVRKDSRRGRIWISSSAQSISLIPHIEELSRSYIRVFWGFGVDSTRIESCCRKTCQRNTLYGFSNGSIGEGSIRTGLNLNIEAIVQLLVGGGEEGEMNDEV